MKKATTDDEATVVPLSGDTEAERQRIRASNTRDQKAEAAGRGAPHNEGYDEAVGRTRRKKKQQLIDDASADPSGHNRQITPAQERLNAKESEQPRIPGRRTESADDTEDTTR